ncbi:MAG: EamA family transporter [Bacillota bacterium]|nr:EamA family transporter [Bacillota bacterium]
MMVILYTGLVVMALLGSLGSLFFKKASGENSIKSLLRKPHFYIGGFLYFVSALLNIILLKYMDYSVVLPMTAITYIWTMIFSYFLLKEAITVRKITGVGFILFGAVLIALR